VELVKAGFASEVEVLRKRGVNPRDMLEQIRTWRREVKGADEPLIFSSDAANDKGVVPRAEPAPPPPPPPEE
jgi:capsid protein